MYHVDNETKHKLYKMFGKTEQTVEEDVKIIKKWLQTQPHFPEIMDDRRIRNMLNICKFNTDKTKRKIDNYYTMRSKYPDMFHDSNPKSSHLKNYMEQIYVFDHPHRVDGVHRVSFVKLKQPDQFDPKNLAKLCLAILEIRLEADFMVDDIFIFDFANLTFRDMCKVTFPLMFKSYCVYKDMFPLRIHSINLINSPSYITALIKVVKFILPVKIFGRIKVCGDDEMLKTIFPVEILPKDYGGNGLSLDELNELCKDKLNKFGKRFDFLDTMKVNESLRPKNCF